MDGKCQAVFIKKHQDGEMTAPFAFVKFHFGACLLFIWCYLILKRKCYFTAHVDSQCFDECCIIIKLVQTFSSYWYHCAFPVFFCLFSSFHFALWKLQLEIDLIDVLNVINAWICFITCSCWTRLCLICVHFLLIRKDGIESSYSGKCHWLRYKCIIIWKCVCAELLL